MERSARTVGLWRYPLPCSISYQPSLNHLKPHKVMAPSPRFRLAPVVVLWPVAVRGWVGATLLIHREGILEQEEHVRRTNVNIIPYTSQPP